MYIVNPVYTHVMLITKKTWLIVVIMIFVLISCRFSGRNAEHAANSQTFIPSDALQAEPTVEIKMILTNTPKSFPSNLQTWIVGWWQQVSSGETYHFTEDFELIQTGTTNDLLGSYRFLSDTELLLPWNREMIQVEVWQLDQNSLLLNFPDGMSIKFVRLSP